MFPKRRPPSLYRRSRHTGKPACAGRRADQISPRNLAGQGQIGRFRDGTDHGASRQTATASLTPNGPPGAPDPQVLPIPPGLRDDDSPGGRTFETCCVIGCRSSQSNADARRSPAIMHRGEFLDVVSGASRVMSDIRQRGRSVLAELYGTVQL